MKVYFLNALHLEEIAEGRWRLIRPFYALVIDESGHTEIMVPQGMETDLCSVPRVPFAYWLFAGKGNRAGVLHDGLYRGEAICRNGGVRVVPSRETADKILLAALSACGVGWLSRRWMWLGVRLGGKAAWGDNNNAGMGFDTVG